MKIHECCALFQQLCDINGKKKTATGTDLIISVTEYIRENFSSPVLSLSATADRFNVNETWLSRVFREQSGITFSAFVENLRMEHARRLLGDTDLTTARIAEACGYYSSNSFCRAFKRYYGYTTTQYRSGDL